jgi:ribosomal protein S18 acetylase RimI-like enzyme
MIRLVRPDDRPALLALQDTLPYADPDLVDAALDGPFVGVVAVDGDRRIGYAIGLPGDPTTLSELVVAPGFRRRGYGRALVEELASMAGGGAIAASTPVGNDGARRFYTALGFERETRRSDAYADGTDALRLVRRE